MGKEDGLGRGKGRQEREEEVESICKDLSGYKNVLITDYRGMDVASLRSLRMDLKKVGSKYRVLKNTLMRIALEREGVEGLGEYLKGPSGVIFDDDEIHTSKVLVGRLNEGLIRIKGGYIEGRIVGLEEVQSLSKIPSREVLMVQLLYSLNFLIYRFINLKVLLLSKLLRVLKEISLRRE